MLLVGLAVLAVAAAVVVGQLAHRAVVAGETDAAARDGARAAETLTPVLLGYDWRTVDADADRIDGVTTGPFAEQNRAIVAGLVVPAARRRARDVVGHGLRRRRRDRHARTASRPWCSTPRPPPATATRPPAATPAAPGSCSSRRPTTDAGWSPGSTRSEGRRKGVPRE